MGKVYLGDALYLNEDNKCYYITNIVETGDRHLLCLTDGRYVYGEDIYEEETEYINKHRNEKEEVGVSGVMEQCIRNQIRNVLDDMDFGKIRDVMEYLGWKWGVWRDSQGKIHTNEIPDKFALETQAEQLLWDAVKGAGTCATGGLEASCGGVFFNEITDEYLFDLKIAFVLEGSLS